MTPTAHIRHVDMAARLAEPPRATEYRVDGLAQDGALTIVCGGAGSGKSWFGMQLSADVQSGRPAAGLDVEQGQAAYVDGEMGERQAVDRFRAAGFAADAFAVLDVQGLNLGAEAGVADLTAELRRLAVRFVVVDSLRRVAPGKRENESDDMAPLVGRLALMARELNAAVVLLHHSGHGDHFARGSTAIGDQADALFGWVQAGDSRRLSCASGGGGKFRFGPEPADRYFRVDIGARDGVVVAAADQKTLTTTTLTKTAVVQYAEQIPGLIAEGHDTRSKIAAALHLNADNRSVRQALGGLATAGAIRHDGAVYSLPVGGGGDPVPPVAAATTGVPR